MLEATVQNLVTMA